MQLPDLGSLDLHRQRPLALPAPASSTEMVPAGRAPRAEGGSSLGDIGLARAEAVCALSRLLEGGACVTRIVCSRFTELATDGRRACCAVLEIGEMHA